MVHQGKSIAQTAICFAGDQIHGFRVDVDLLLLAERFQAVHDRLDGDAFEIIALAAGNDGGDHLVRLGGGEDEEHIFRRFFQGLEQGVERTFGEHVHFVDDIDFILRLAGGIHQLPLQLADVIHTGVRSAVDLDHIGRNTSGYLVAVVAVVAGGGGGAFHAIQAFGQYPGHRGLPHTPGSGEQIGMGDPVAEDRIVQYLRDMLLGIDLGKGLGTVFAR